MSSSRSKLYFTIILACMAGYAWLFYYSVGYSAEDIKVPNVCFIRYATNIPCPSCGSTRSVISLLHGHFLESIYLNPLGLIIAVIMILAPCWILFDFMTQKKSLYNFYIRLEEFLKHPNVAIPLIILVIINWAWNISKEL